VSADEELHAIGVAGIVLSEGRLLLMRRRDAGHWEPPGGALKAGELIEEGVAREIKEETGVDVEVRELTGIYQNLKHGVISFVFSCRAQGEATGETEEAMEIQWVDENEALIRLSEDYGQWVRDCFEPGDRIPLRAQSDTIKAATSSPHSTIE
jgi:8-oxo-dGTP diphosphatase